MAMSPDERAAYFQDPGYGRVSDLCISLGYGDASNASRSYNTLSQRTIDFRKNFIKRTAGLINFPLQYDAPEAQQCASEFLAAYDHLFHASDESRAASWLSLPDDKPRILDTIAKLICTQESMFRRNDEYLRRKKKEKVTVPENSDSELEGHEEEIAMDISDSTIHVVAEHPRPNTETTEPHEPDSTGMQRNIESHLEYTYPMGDAYPVVPSDWLFDPRHPWPNNEKSFAFRYFHERNFYATSKKSKNVKRFAQALKTRLNIESDVVKDIVIWQRCKQLIKDISSLWSEKGNGFIVKTSTGFVKTPQFENAWRFHRTSWIFRVHRGITDGVVELNQAFAPVIKQEKQPGKRLQNIQPALPSLTSTTSSEPSTKRARYSIGHGAGQEPTQNSVPPERHEDAITVQATRTQNHMPVINQTAPQPTIRFEQDSAPRAPAFTPVNILPSNASAAELRHQVPPNMTMRPLERDTRLRSSALTNEIDQPRQSRDSLPARTSNITYDLLNLDSSRQTRSLSAGTVAEIVPGAPPVSAPATAPIATLAPDHHPQEPALTPIPISTPDTKTPIDSKPELRMTETPEPSTTQPKRLSFILENSKRSPDHDNHLSAETFRSSSINEFFALFCERSGRDRAATTYLTFKYNWGYRDSFTVKEYGNEVHWEEIKERVKDTFLMARDRLRRHARFQVWVMGPEEEDEEW
ncbi:hypothetical protein EG329_004922 [Mollisiaceae sp. DMI_Dod_QoI]|nr:hypothetical protein EG329_004922 [Helotiales sp. DMI_Dod_QoI]